MRALSLILLLTTGIICLLVPHFYSSAFNFVAFCIGAYILTMAGLIVYEKE